jgi:hypothetical protein
MELPDLLNNEGKQCDHAFKELLEKINKSLLTNYPSAVKINAQG